jgi:hypothetical protein
MAAKAVDISPNPAGASVRYRRRGRAEIERLQVGAVVDCTGIVKNPDATGNPVMRSLFNQGLARIDPLRMGIEVAPDCAIVNNWGLPSRRLFAVGPLTRAAFWEIIAIPDIRSQCVRLAEQFGTPRSKGIRARVGKELTCRFADSCDEAEGGARRSSLILSRPAGHRSLAMPGTLHSRHIIVHGFGNLGGQIHPMARGVGDGST